MSKNHQGTPKPAYADWTVRLNPNGTSIGMPAAPECVTIVRSVFTRAADGGYVFTDKDGVTADFPPGTVLHVMRKEPDAKPESGPWPLNLPGAADEKFDDDPRKRGTAASVKSGA